MHKYTEKELISQGYKIENAKITSVSISMSDHCCLTSNICLEGAGWACCYGGYCLGHGYLGAKEFDGSPQGLVSLMRIMDIVGVEKWEDLKGKLVRVATKSWGDTIKIIGDIIIDKWFDYESFFEEKDEVKIPIMSPGEFECKIRSITERDDPELNHSDMDDLMCDLLTSLGYEKGIEVFEKAEKWYS